MTILLDTNILVRFANPADSDHSSVVSALEVVRRKGYRPSIVPQVLYEFWVVATRLPDQNGLGMSIAEAESDVTNSIRKFSLFRDERAVFAHWIELVVQHEVAGKTAHDARIVAAMQRHDIEHILTFNDTHFSRFSAIKVISPANAESLPTIT